MLTVRGFELSSVQNGIYALRKVHMRSTPSLKFPQRCLWSSSSVRRIDDGPLSSFQGRSSSASSFHASVLQAIGGVLSLALCPQVVSQAPCSKPLVRVAFPAIVSARSFLFTPACSRQCTHRVFEGGCWPLTHSSLGGFPFHFSLFVASSLNLWERWLVWSDCHLWRQSSGGHMAHQASLSPTRYLKGHFSPV